MTVAMALVVVAHDGAEVFAEDARSGQADRVEGTQPTRPSSSRRALMRSASPGASMLNPVRQDQL
jgi:hypothetical protein